jgi:hypothetical protein
MRSLDQELTFEMTRKEFGLREVDFGLQQMRTLKLIRTGFTPIGRFIGLILKDIVFT